MSTEPVAASTAGEVKFSDAMSWIVPTSGGRTPRRSAGPPRGRRRATRRRATLRRSPAAPGAGRTCLGTSADGKPMGRVYPAPGPVPWRSIPVRYAMVLDPRTPVLVGVGQITDRPGESNEAHERHEPLGLMVRAIRAALADAGGHSSRLLSAVGSIRTVRSFQWLVPDPGALVSAELGIAAHESLCSSNRRHHTAGVPGRQRLADRERSARRRDRGRRRVRVHPGQGPSVR